ncbi:nucleotide sugar dehydrogenase [Pectobacterium parvum]|uniref:Nucleotide sugar dehydrogenase n=1 Tax=Pectobacterium parvum TaxID=2778550 RepID=A0AAP9LC33_9GAMM|nr:MULTISPECIES: nucleotide sugar dehydrogenase [Pectobacterium]GKW40876.1 UDP-N-acetyl-D-glucosamine dehydrogenase [Pectobacterium carotovorum subsp. carotovorum]MCU1800697.1 nucleotide sugar dehydrogenase [Pectobacterium parvum]QHQ23234.1 nucleotide sugar dehydrogenase [Pectobacterium parvum]UFK38895.1 nucleotide sugar dehydrogenase [Pectobacterium parvum]UVD97016.1 nucleotide sugar dehydrogenase [Pectobacterium parvum]
MLNKTTDQVVQNEIINTFNDSEYFDRLNKKISLTLSNVMVVGVGYVGIPLIKRLGETGFSVVGYDVDEAKIESLQKGISPIPHISEGYFNQAAHGSKICFTSQASIVNDMDVIIICVPTPLTVNNTPDMSYIESALESLVPHIKKGTLISLESTTFPGTTEEIILPFLKKNGFSIGYDIFLGYSPEREDPGNKQFDLNQIPKIVSGCSDECKFLMEKLYSLIVDQIVPVSSPRAAEMTKIVENTQRFINISLVNELKMIADKMSIDIFEVINAASTKPFGFTPYYPGPGIGGHCIPVDPHYLNWKCKEYGIKSRFIELAEDINLAMPNYIVNKIQVEINKSQKSLFNSNILVMGVSYKKDVGDIRDSPVIKIIELLIEQGVNISFFDPYIDRINIKKRTFLCENLELKKFDKYDAILIATDHTQFNYKELVMSAQLIIDARGIYKELPENIKRA